MGLDINKMVVKLNLAHVKGPKNEDKNIQNGFLRPVILYGLPK